VVGHLFQPLSADLGRCIEVGGGRISVILEFFSIAVLTPWQQKHLEIEG
jgi:hypothetical protein